MKHREFRIPSFGPVSALRDSTEIGNALQTAANVLLRPAGAIKGVPRFERLWGIGAEATMAATIRNIDAPGGGKLSAAHKTVALRVRRQGKSFLFFYSLPTDRCRGLFYLGDDGSYSSGAYDFATGPATWEVLATGLHDTARWYGASFYGQLMLQNGQDSPVCVQLRRTAKAPGIWRLAASNARPATPVVSLQAPSKDNNVAAFWTIPGSVRAGGVDLTFTAHADNFPGAQGNLRIYVEIVNDPYAGGITSALTGAGTLADPYLYTLNTGPSAAASSNDALVAFVNQDTKALAVLSAATAAADNTADSQSWAATPLDDGEGNGLSDGFANRTVSVYARYWDSGVDNLGYEGISSLKSNEVIIDGMSANDIVVQVPLNPSVEGGRFDGIRIYLQFGEDAEASWYLVEPSNPVSNLASPPFTLSLPPLVPVNINSVNATDNAIRLNKHRFKAGQPVQFASTGTLPAPLLPNTTYFVRNVTTNTFKVAATLGGGVINITNAGTGTRTVAPVLHQIDALSHGFGDGDKLRLTSTGTLPAGLLVDTDYYVITATENSFALASKPGGPPVLVTNTGTGVHTAHLHVKTVVIGSNAVFGQEMYVDQNRPLEHVHIVNVNGQLWRGGVRDYPERLYPSKPATEDELAPEGANADAYEIAQGINAAGSGRVTALYSDGYRLHIHSADGIRLLNPADPDDQQVPPLITGAINGTALTTWTGSKLFYLGADLNLYEFNGTRYGKRDANLATAGAAAYLRERVDLAEVGRAPERVFMLPDVQNQFIWFWLPALGGGLQGYAFDFTVEGITGPFDAPVAYAAAHMEPERPEIVFADEAGNLFVWDTAAQHDHGDTLPGQPPLTSYPVPDAPPVSHAGYPAALWEGRAYRQAVISEFETGFFDLQTPAQKKVWAGVVFTSVKNSRGLVEITAIGKNTGHIVTRMYGDLGAHQTILCSHKLLFNRLDTAIKLRVRVLGAEQKTWTLRDLTLLWHPAGPV